MPIDVALFAQDWYHRMINQQLNAHPKASPDALAIADAIMTAGAFMSEAITHAFEEQGHTETVQSALRDIAGGLDKLADQVEVIAEAQQ